MPKKRKSKKHSQMPKLNFTTVTKKLRNPRFRPLVIVVAFAITGTIALVMSKAATSTTSIQPESGLWANGANQQTSAAGYSGDGYVRFGAPTNSGVRRFFSDDASWNKTISQLGGEFTELKPYAYRLWDYGGGTTTNAPPGTFYLDLKDYSVPIYDATTATTTIHVFQTSFAIDNGIAFSTPGGVPIGGTIPWNPAWKPGTGYDKIMAVVNYQTGKVYEFWRVDEPLYNCVNFTNFAAGLDLNRSDWTCIAGVGTYDNLWTAKDGETTLGRGMGINKLALTVRADEVATGNIGHAIPITISNPMFGPTMVNPPYDALQPGAGTSKAFYMKPATRLEHIDPSTLALGGTTVVPHTDEERAKTVPSGMRFGLRLSEADITTWLDSKGYTGAKRASAATFARAWRDYGAVVAETGGWGIGIETDGVIGPAKQKWAELGFPEDSNGLDFTGLITRERLYVVKPPN